MRWQMASWRKQRVYLCVVSCLNLLSPHTNIQGNTAMTPASARQRRPRDQQRENQRPELENANWPLSSPPPPYKLYLQPHTHTFYPHASLPARAVWSHTLSQDPDFTQPIHCVSANNPLALSADERLRLMG